jgi:hypothetical protein
MKNVKIDSCKMCFLFCLSIVFVALFQVLLEEMVYQVSFLSEFTLILTCYSSAVLIIDMN